MLSVETVIVIVVCLLVLILSTMYVMGMVGTASNDTSTTEDIYSECMQWQRFGYSDDTNLVFTQKNYPALWQTYLSECIDPKTKAIAAACDLGTDAGKKKISSLIQNAKNFCTNEKPDEGSAASNPSSGSSDSTTTGNSNNPNSNPSTHKTTNNAQKECKDLNKGYSDGTCLDDCTGYTDEGTCLSGKKLCCRK